MTRPDGEISAAEVRKLITQVRAVSDFEQEHAEIILPGCSAYLNPISIKKLIRAELSHELAKSEIRNQKSFILRMEALFPTLSLYFTQAIKLKIESLVRYIEDCFVDFMPLGAAPRRDRAWRELQGKLTTAAQTMRSSVQSLEAVSYLLNADFNDLQKAYETKFPDTSKSQITLDDLARMMKFACEFLELASSRARVDENYPFKQQASARSHVVTFAHLMCLAWDGPILVTTPGSSFSEICGLLYEIVSGQKDEGLAGAINRYARSAEREENELEERLFRDEEGEEIDNFHQQRNDMRFFLNRLLPLQKFLRKQENSKNVPWIARLLHDYYREKVMKAASEYGPHELKMADATTELDPQGVETLTRKLQELDVEIGKLRREQGLEPVSA